MSDTEPVAVRNTGGRWHRPDGFFDHVACGTTRFTGWDKPVEESPLSEIKLKDRCPHCWPKEPRP